MKTRDISYNFSDKTAVIIGGSRGIGLEVSKQFLNSGAKVICISRTKPNLICDSSPKLEFIKCDLSSPNQIKHAFELIDNLDFLINVAGTNLCEPIENIDQAEWNRVIDINLRSFFLAAKFAIK